MALTIIDLRSPPQSGKSLIAIGAAKEFVRRYGSGQCVVFFPKLDQAVWAARKYDLPSTMVASASRDDTYIVQRLAGKMFVVCEDLDHWPVSKFEFFKASLVYCQKNIPDTVPRTLITTATTRY